MIAFLLITSLSSGQIQKETVNGWYIVDTLNVWEASSQIHTFGGIWEDSSGDNYQIFRLKTYDAGKPSYGEFEKRIPKIKTPKGFIWFSGLVAAFPRESYLRYMFFIGDSSGMYKMEQPYQFNGNDSFILTPWEGYFRTALPDSIDRIRIRLYPAPYSNNLVRIMEIGFDYLRGVKENGDYFLIDPFEDTTIVGVEDEPSIPKGFTLSQNYPNPFNPQTKIRFELSSTKFVKLQVFDILGKEITTLVNEDKYSGTYEVVFDASHLPSGIYIYHLMIDTYTISRKMTYLK